MPVAALIRLLGVLGVDPPSVRSAVSRLKRRGLLVPARTAAGAAAYGLSDAARQLLEDGDRRIFGRPAARLSDGWVLAVFSVPEEERHKRHLLRSRLARLGFGTAAPGVWIAPAQLYEETRHTLERLQLSPYVDLFTGEHAGFAPTADAVARWWDLDALAARHRAFLDEQEPVLRRWSRRRSVPPKRPTATICWRWTPGVSCPTRIPDCPLPSCLRTGRGPRGGRVQPAARRTADRRGPLRARGDDRGLASSLRRPPLAARRLSDGVVGPPPRRPAAAGQQRSPRPRP